MSSVVNKLLQSVNTNKPHKPNLEKDIKSRYGDYKGRDHYYEPFKYFSSCYNNPSDYGQLFRREHDYYWGICGKGRNCQNCRNCSHAKRMTAFQGIA